MNIYLYIYIKLYILFNFYFPDMLYYNIPGPKVGRWLPGLQITCTQSIIYTFLILNTNIASILPFQIKLYIIEFSSLIISLGFGKDKER